METNGKYPVVETIYGKVRGIHRNGLFEFKGIPFAAPPVGQHRWLPPEPCQPWAGVLEALAFKPAAPQNAREASPLPGFEIIENQNEDCLYLNIWTPGLDNAKRPVMVWIHGGGFITGAGSQTLYRGDNLALVGNMVIVSLNYRLGLLGFLNLDEVTAGKIPATGNEGLLDQLAGLQWVKENITVFGGDPDNVTVFGESSGAMSIACLLAMPKSQGLFQKAILESGTGKMARSLSLSTQAARDFLQIAGSNGRDFESLRALPVDKILSIQREMSVKAPGGITPVAPVIDGKILPGPPLEIVRSGSGIKVPILIGNNLDENKISYLRQPAMLNMDQETLIRLCQSIVSSKDIPQLIETYKKARTQRGEPVGPADIFSAIRGDAMFRVPSVQLAQAICENGQKAYNYLFTWKSPALGGILGACHTLEMGFVFGRLDPVFHGTGYEAKMLSRQIQNAWFAFARTGDPGCPDLDWPPYLPGRKTMMLGATCQIVEGAYEEERQIWEALGETLPV